MKWIKLYAEDVIRGTTISELNIAERGIWFTMLALAGISPDEGYLYLRQEVGYSDATLSELIGCTPEELLKCIALLIKHKKIEVDKQRVIHICNWEKYQDNYHNYRVRSYIKGKQKTKTTESNVCTNVCSSVKQMLT